MLKFGASLEWIVQTVEKSGLDFEKYNDFVMLKDPDKNVVILKAALHEVDVEGND